MNKKVSAPAVVSNRDSEYVTLIPNTMNNGSVMVSNRNGDTGKLHTVTLYPRKKTEVPKCIADQLYANQKRVNRSIAVPDGNDIESRMNSGKGGDGGDSYDRAVYEQPKGYTIIFHNRD